MRSEPLFRRWVLSAGNLSCDGSSHLISDYPDLFAKIGTIYGSVDALHFTLPLLTDTNRFLRAAGGSLAVGTYQANQNKSHTHTGSGTTATESVAHSHSGSGTTGGMQQNDPHTHGVTGTSSSNVVVGANSGGLTGPGTPGPVGAQGLAIESTSINHTHAFSVTTGTESANHTHTYSFTTSAGSADGTEARPEALAVVISIRF